MTREEANKELDKAMCKVFEQLDIETTVQVLQDLNQMTEASLLIIIREAIQHEQDLKQPSNC